MAVVQAAVLLLFVVAMLVYIYIATVGQLVRDADAAADLEYNYLDRAYAEGGISRLRQEVVERSERQNDMLYVLIDSSGQTLFQDITDIPRLPGVDAEHVDFHFQRPRPDGDDVSGQGRGRIGRLLGGPVLLVVRDLGGAAEIAGRITGALWWLAVLGVLFSIFGGLVAGLQAAQRVEILARVTHEVVKGDLTQRAPERGGRDEFDQLARALNTMLERLEKLVHTTRTAGDSIAHDLRTPLTRLRQRLEAAVAAAPSSEDEGQALRAAVEETDRLLNTFESILRVSRIESVANWRLDPIDVTALVADLVEFYEPLADEAGIALTHEIAPALRVKGELGLVTLALSNLIENAIKYTPKPGRIEVRAGLRADGRLELAVIDDGPGVPVEDRDRVTERFVRLESSRSTEGSGLGLSLVSAVARLHRGVLSLGDGLGGHNCPGLRAALVLPALA